MDAHSLGRRGVRRLTMWGRGAMRPATAAQATGERGSVVLETALGIPVLVVVAVALAWGIGAGLAALSLADTARDAARALARGETVAEVIDRANRQAPAAIIDVLQDDATVTVRARRTMSLPILGDLGVDLEQKSIAAREDSW